MADLNALLKALEAKQIRQSKALSETEEQIEALYALIQQKQSQKPK